jgi:hypothetical protein
MRLERLFHFPGARLEYVQQISMTAFEILQNVRKQKFGCHRIQRENAIDDVVRPRLVEWVQIARLDSRAKRPHDDPRGIGAQIVGLSMQEHGFGQIVHQTLSGLDLPLSGAERENRSWFFTLRLCARARKPPHLG